MQRNTPADLWLAPGPPMQWNASAETKLQQPSPTCPLSCRDAVAMSAVRSSTKAYRPSVWTDTFTTGSSPAAGEGIHKLYEHTAWGEPSRAPWGLM